MDFGLVQLKDKEYLFVCDSDFKPGEKVVSEVSWGVAVGTFIKKMNYSEAKDTIEKLRTETQCFDKTTEEYAFSLKHILFSIPDNSCFSSENKKYYVDVCENILDQYLKRLPKELSVINNSDIMFRIPDIEDVYKLCGEKKNVKLIAFNSFFRHTYCEKTIPVLVCKKYSYFEEWGSNITAVYFPSTIHIGEKENAHELMANLAFQPNPELLPHIRRYQEDIMTPYRLSHMFEMYNLQISLKYQE